MLNHFYLEVNILIKEILDKYYYSVTISELQMTNNRLLSPDITYNSQLYLDIIHYTENCTASLLAKMLNISKPAVTSKINELMSLGLVMKVRSSSDKRVYYLKTTDEVSHSYTAYDRAIDRATAEIAKSFSQEEIKAFCKILNKLTDIYIGEIENGNKSD